MKNRKQEKDKRTNNDLQNITHKTKDQVIFQEALEIIKCIVRKNQ